MKRTTLGSLAALVLVSGCYFPSGAAVTPSIGVSVSSFDPYLEPYGTWLDLPGYGRTWQPAPQYVGADFYPYGTGGQWMYTDAGWVFESDYPFGWAVFHYGRWFRHASYGWLWVPGDQWAPSWVSWRVGGPYVGWAPLGPTGALGFSYSNWCFVPASTFTVRNVRAYSTGSWDFHRAVNVTSPARVGRVGPPPRYISRATGVNIRPVPVGAVRSSVPPARPPPPRTSGWRSAPPPSSGFTRPAPGVRTPPPPSTFSSPRSAPPPSGGFSSPRSAPPPSFRSSPPAPAPMQAPSRVQPSAPRSPQPPSAAPAPSYRAPPSSFRSAPAPAPSYRSAPAPSYRSAPPAPRSAPAPSMPSRPPPPRR